MHLSADHQACSNVNINDVCVHPGTQVPACPPEQARSVHWDACGSFSTAHALPAQPALYHKQGSVGCSALPVVSDQDVATVTVLVYHATDGAQLEST